MQNMDPGPEDVMGLLLCGKRAFSLSKIITLLYRKKHRLPEKQFLKYCVGQILPCRPQNTKHHNQQYSKRSMAIQTPTTVKVKSGTRVTFKRSPCAFSQQIQTENRGGGEEREESYFSHLSYSKSWDLNSNKYIYSAWDSSNFGTISFISLILKGIILRKCFWRECSPASPELDN